VYFREKVIEVAVGVGTLIAQIWKDRKGEFGRLGRRVLGCWFFRALVGCRHTDCADLEG
jgi:hypothetical protein